MLVFQHKVRVPQGLTVIRIKPNCLCNFGLVLRSEEHLLNVRAPRSFGAVANRLRILGRVVVAVCCRDQLVSPRLCAGAVGLGAEQRRDQEKGKGNDRDNEFGWCCHRPAV